jgi:hypothetical protein
MKFQTKIVNIVLDGEDIVVLDSTGTVTKLSQTDGSIM